MTTTCRRCGGERTLVEREERVVRGERVSRYLAQYWRCARCRDPETGEEPYLSADRTLLERNVQAAKDAWQAQFGEPLPPKGRPGRPPAGDAPRDKVVTIRMSRSELERIDRARGDRSRSDFLRDAGLAIAAPE